MPEPTLKRASGIAYREAGSPETSHGSPVLCLHGWPQSSYMWRHLLPALASAGRRVLAPDLPGFGDSPPDPPGTWERHVEAVERFRQETGLEQVVLVVHDTGGGIGLRWACDHPDAVCGMVITNTGFFPDYEWHELARAMRTEGQGEALVDSLSRDGLGTLLEAASSGIDERAVDEYWKAFSTAGHRRAMLELYRSFDLDELAPYEGKLARLAVPTLVLWGEQDEFLPRDYAPRFTREIPGAELVLLETARHFLFEDEPKRCAQEVMNFLRRADDAAMSKENVERLKVTYDAFNRKDFDAAAQVAHPEIEFVRTAGQPPIRGVDAFRAWMNPDAFEKQTQEPLDFKVNGNKVLVHSRARARGAGSGIIMEGETWVVWTFDDDGRVRRAEAFLAHEKDQAVEAAGLSE